MFSRVVEVLAIRQIEKGTIPLLPPRPRWEGILERGISGFLALLLALPAAVLLLPLYFLYLVTVRDRGGFFYRGARLGKGKTVFTMYKVRSLKSGAESRLKSELHVSGSSEELWYGNFIRRTRLDELPQLLNVVRGDMDFVGPRPERPEVYEAKLRFMPEYDLRFLVKPGLTGLSQLITPHSTPKRIRAAIDNRFFVRQRNVLLKYLLFLHTLQVFAWKILYEGCRKIADPVLVLVLGKPGKCRRSERRYFPKDVYCSIHILMDIDPELQNIISGILTNEFRVRNVNRKEVLVEGKREAVGALLRCMRLRARAVQGDEGHLELKLQLNRWKGVKTKIVNCSGRILAMRTGKWGPNRQILLSYQANSAIDRYFIDKYLLKESFA